MQRNGKRRSRSQAGSHNTGARIRQHAYRSRVARWRSQYFSQYFEGVPAGGRLRGWGMGRAFGGWAGPLSVTVSVTILIPVSQPARLRLKVLPITIGRSDRQAPFTPSVGDLANAARRLSLGAALTLLATTTALLGGVFQLGRTVGPRPQGADVGETRCRREVAGGSTAEL